MLSSLSILMLCVNYQGHGTYWRAFGFAKKLVQKGHRVYLLCSTPLKAETSEVFVDGVQIIQHFDSHGAGYDINHALWRLWWLRGKQFDIVHCFETRPTNLIPLAFLKLKKFPIVLDWCDWFGKGGAVEERAEGLQKTLLRPIETHFENRYRHFGNMTTVINSVLQERAVKMGVSAESTALILNGANLEQVQLADKQLLRKQLNLPIDGHILAYTGTMFESDASLMIESFIRLIQEMPTIHLLLIGYLNIDFGLRIPPEKVTITGKLPYRELMNYVSASDIGWLTLSNSNANRGRFPMKIHDFVAAGRPVLVTDVGDLPKFITHYQLGAVATANTESIVSTTIELLNQLDSPIYSDRTLRHTTEQFLSWERVTEQLQTVYAKVLAGKAK